AALSRIVSRPSGQTGRRRWRSDSFGSMVLGMKSLLFALVAAAVGIAVGAAAAFWRSGLPSAGDPFDIQALQPSEVVKVAARGPTGGGPRVVVTRNEGGSKGTLIDA